MNLRLVFRANQRSLKFPLAAGEYIVGSAPDCDIHLPHPTVSSRHARIRFDGKTASIEDLGSRNGTLVNFRRAETPVPLGHGSELSLGAVSGILEAVSAGELQAEVLLAPQQEARAPVSTPDALPASAFGVEHFFAEHLPTVLETLLEDRGSLEVTQQVGSRVFSTLPLTRLEILQL
ncbi:MAG: FHA domain-containing protein, partial [Acidobacteria bacterium]|nr:FHA domain-containing protein [Acidobacteriota bacterium]